MDRNKLKLTGLLLITLVPILLATLVFWVSEQQGVSATTNRGTLIIPPLDITDLDMRDEAGELVFRTFEEEVAQIDLDDYQPRPWMLVTLGGERCDEACAERLYFLRQIHRRLGADEIRVERYYQIAAESPRLLDASTRELFNEQFPQMKVTRGDRSVILDNLARTLESGQSPVEDHYIYVVDPVGNVMLYFTPQNSPEDILADVEKLLDQSSLG